MYERTNSYQLELGYESNELESCLLMEDYTPLYDYLHIKQDTKYAEGIAPLLQAPIAMNPYPWPKMDESPKSRSVQLLHRSEGAILFKLTTSTTERVIKHFRLNTQLLKEAHFEAFLELVAKLKALHHQGVVTILQAHASTQGIYVVMEYVEGVTLKDWLRDEPLPALEQRLAWYQKIVEAVNVLHQAGIVHGDLKSSNIMIRSNNQPVLLDFGLDGQLLREAGALAEGEIYGTPYYVSPELIMGDPLDQQADIYALGVLFYEILTGQKPYQGRSLDLILRKHMLAPIPKLPDDLARYQPILNQTMAKIPESRFASAQQLLAAL
ncbi:serine/threonine protein kinase [Thiofilum flexile]|uniref:serine/threonine protein kinase n=1 Tax=Thiofilum flexile TaxID=125627 RepID=UPI00035CB2C8|nr:serine/threonine-protein kinase [Thiofilum flexile]